MELTGRHFDRIPRTNLRIPAREFARLWLTAERRADAMEAAGEPEDSYLRGVCSTCEWLAGVIIRVHGVNGPTSVFVPSPVTGIPNKAYEELIADETRAAEQVVADSPPGKPGFVDGVFATLNWAWRRSGVPPIEVDTAQAG
ncbi:hypothetical protein [Kribbella sp. VKM Ac-2568]|uniref:hypothetical protein n=1 Tax=Kribbella sp. VKM Ac-2568 TaxID=2512219 RepID=UPI001050CFA1|nr:hypothetical protein [Kribbella sp. VKM Ac-2568]TCM35127.1 hypothetical protein EV648_12520 [Kribbella sp. VKM Ac-2568]